MNDREITQRRAAIESAWRRDGDKDPNTSDVDQAEAKTKAAATQRDWDQRAKPTPNRDRLAQPRTLEPWERSSDDAVKRERGDAKRSRVPRQQTEDSRSSAPRHTYDAKTGKGFDARPWVTLPDGSTGPASLADGSRTDAKGDRMERRS